MYFRYLASFLLLLCFSFSTVPVGAAPGDAVISGARWSRSVDAVTGLIKVRLELETSKPVEVEHFITKLPNWRLIATFKGTAADKLTIPLSPDTVVVTGTNVVAADKDTRIVVDFPEAVTAQQYRVFTLPADSKAKRPFRVVIEADRIVPVSHLKFLAGLKGKVVVLDPGHGGSDPGAIGVRGTREKQLNLDLAMLAKNYLEKAGAKVLMTRERDNDVHGPKATDREELWARVLVANKNGADVFVSIHHNASVNPEANGTTTYFFAKTLFDGDLARSLQAAMVESGGLVDKGTRTANFFVVKNATMPAALLEVGFMSNSREEMILADPAFREKIAQAIVKGIDQFFTQAAKMRGGR